MFYEFRTYTCLPGKMPIVLKRFESCTMVLFKKYGIRHGPLMTVAVGDDNMQVKYLIEWDSHEQRDKAWTAFRADPAWQEALSVTEKDGPTLSKISNELLTAVPFSLK